MTGILTFDEPTHRYELDGVVLPSVTQILQVLGGYEGIPKHILDIAAARGTAIHRATELEDLGTLDYGSLDDELIPYLMAWQKFKDDTKPELIGIEVRGYHPLLKYAGGYDRTLVLGSGRYKGTLSVLDLKSSWQMMPATAPQTAAYQEMINAHEKDKSNHVKQRLGLQLKRDGNYELHPYKDPADYNTFVSCLNVVRWKEKHQKKVILSNEY
jgi:hypothetical protein